jgi:hypothetical protein
MQTIATLVLCWVILGNLMSPTRWSWLWVSLALAALGAQIALQIYIALH